MLIVTSIQRRNRELHTITVSNTNQSQPQSNVGAKLDRLVRAARIQHYMKLANEERPLKWEN